MLYPKITCFIFTSSAVDCNKDMGTDNRDTLGYLPPDEWSPIETLFSSALVFTASGGKYLSFKLLSLPASH